MLLKDDVINKIIERLRVMHVNAVCELNYGTPYELLVAVVLSAQCTDKRVNTVTSKLFVLANTPQKMLLLGLDEIKTLIKPCGCYNRKAESIMNLSYALLQNFDGQVPSRIDDLITLDGVGRKTANVVHSVAFHGDAIAVDTHVQRVSNRIGIADSDKVAITEQQLMEAVPRETWSEFHHLLIHHGRYICKARKPDCDNCLLTEYCKFYNEK